MKQVILCGLADNEIKKDLLGVTGINDKTLAKTLGLIEDKETASRSTASSSAAGHRSRQHFRSRLRRRTSPDMKAWLLDRYSASTFNRCSHQPLPMMNCTPLRIHIDPEAESVAHHNARPVLVHLREKVKAQLEKDIRLGVIERVPVPSGRPRNGSPACTSCRSPTAS